MKAPQIIALALCVGQASANPGAPVMRDAATHDQLALGQRQAQQEDPMRKLAVSEGEDPSVQDRPVDLLSRSDVICFNGMATLVPKRAILTLPEKLKERLTGSPGSRLVPWSEFFVANRAWITTEEVTYNQAAGIEAMPEEATARLSRSGNLVVATYLGGPISVAAPVSPQPKN